jgi:uncharacterized membrane protein
VAAEITVTKPDIESALYAGAITTAIVYLLPYVNDFIITAYVVGALVAVWYAVKKRGQFLGFKEGAKLGFLSTLFGGIAAAIVFDIIWQFFDYQLWQKQNSDLMIAIFSSFAGPATIDIMKMKMAEQATKPFSSYTIIFQLIGGLILSGVFGSLFGLLGVKIFQRGVAR